MNTLTLDHAKIIVCSATSSASALAALKQAGFDVWQSSLDPRHYGVYFDSGSVAFSDCSLDGEFYVFFNSKLIHPAQRQQFLESQQNPTSVVPAAESVEAHPELCIACHHPRAKVQNADEAAFYPVVCPKCGLDFDRDVFDYSPETAVEAHPTTPTEEHRLEDSSDRVVFQTPEQLLEALSPVFALQGAYGGFLRLVLTGSLVASENLSTCSAEPHQFDVLDLSLREFMVAIAESKTRFNQLVDTHRNTYPQKLLISKV